MYAALLQTGELKLWEEGNRDLWSPIVNEIFLRVYGGDNDRGQGRYCSTVNILMGTRDEEGKVRAVLVWAVGDLCVG